MARLKKTLVLTATQTNHSLFVTEILTVLPHATTLDFPFCEPVFRSFWEMNGKKKLPPRSGCGLEAVEPHP